MYFIKYKKIQLYFTCFIKYKKSDFYGSLTFVMNFIFEVHFHSWDSFHPISWIECAWSIWSMNIGSFIFKSYPYGHLHLWWILFMNIILFILFSFNLLKIPLIFFSFIDIIIFHLSVHNYILMVDLFHEQVIHEFGIIYPLCLFGALRNCFIYVVKLIFVYNNYFPLDELPYPLFLAFPCHACHIWIVHVVENLELPIIGSKDPCIFGPWNILLTINEHSWQQDEWKFLMQKEKEKSILHLSHFGP